MVKNLQLILFKVLEIIRSYIKEAIILIINIFFTINRFLRDIELLKFIANYISKNPNKFPTVIWKVNNVVFALILKYIWSIISQAEDILS